MNRKEFMEKYETACLNSYSIFKQEAKYKLSSDADYEDIIAFTLSTSIDYCRELVKVVLTEFLPIED